MQYLYAFLIGGLICGIGQILIDKTKLTSARILVLFVVLGVVFTAIGVYEPLVNFAGAGATVPLTGFGYLLAKGVTNEILDVRAFRYIYRWIKSNSRRRCSCYNIWVFSINIIKT